MKQLIKISLGVLLLSLSALSVKQSNERSTLNLNVNLQNLLHINQAQAESGEGDCIDNGYKNWGDTGGPDGMDCLCIEREGVKNDCN
ncbi:MAG: hypothetical protein K0B11_14705 [Mariniphaga sp.]|nr:hypothetical protein [Mariniphaga sp.]